MSKNKKFIDLFEDDETERKKVKVKRKKQSGGVRKQAISEKDTRKRKKKKSTSGSHDSFKVKAKSASTGSVKSGVKDPRVQQEAKKKVDRRTKVDTRKGRTSLVASKTKSKGGKKTTKKVKTKRTGVKKNRKKVDKRTKRVRKQEKRKLVTKPSKKPRPEKNKNYKERKRPEYQKEKVKAVYHYKKGTGPSKKIKSVKRPKNQRKRDTKPIKEMRAQLKAIREHKMVEGARHSKWKNELYQKAHYHTRMDTMKAGAFRDKSVRNYQLEQFMKNFKVFAEKNNIEIENRVIKRWAFSMFYQQKELKLRGRYKDIFEAFKKDYGWKLKFTGQYIDSERYQLVLSKWNISTVDHLYKIYNDIKYRDKWERIKEELVIESSDDALVFDTIGKALSDKTTE